MTCLVCFAIEIRPFVMVDHPFVEFDRHVHVNVFGCFGVIFEQRGHI